jgi:DNA-directed RNA polymerase subunit E'/Rpb7
VGVFEDVFIAKDELPQPCYFNQVEGLWVWKYDDNDLYFELLEKVRFRVLGIEFAERVNLKCEFELLNLV